MKRHLVFFWVLIALGWCTSAQTIAMWDAGITSKGLWVSPMLRYQVTPASSLEWTVPINWSIAFNDRSMVGNVYLLFTELRYVRTVDIGSYTFQVIPSLAMFLPLDHKDIQEPSTLLAPGLGVGKQLVWKEWMIRPEISLSITRNLYSTSGGMGGGAGWTHEYIYSPWPSVGLTLYR